MPDGSARPIQVYLVANEESGDRLGAALMRAIRKLCANGVTFAGVGGREMVAEGLADLFTIRDSVIGLAPILAALPSIMRRIRETAEVVIAANPDILVIIDSPAFTHRVARRVRAAAPWIPILDYVSPQVWASRPGRARKMRGYIDRILAVYPFEEQVHEKLGGPPCVYVGHPLVERAGDLRPTAEDARRRGADPAIVLLLPGSRPRELRHLIEPFGDAVELVASRLGAIQLILPTVPSLTESLKEVTAGWAVRPRIVDDQFQKNTAFRVARAALAASGTVTLELALAGIPTVAAYRLTAWEAFILRRLVRVPSIVLPNLVIGENVVPEYLQEDCAPEGLAQALIPLLSDTPERRKQIEAFARLDAIMEIGTVRPSERAAEAVLAAVTQEPCRESGRRVQRDSR